jgi:hypothetical protein
MACLIAVLLANGGHWAVLQSIAWSRMLVEYARENSVVEAVQMTFDGEHPCEMCHRIEAGRQQEDKQGVPLLKWERLPEYLAGCGSVAVPLPPCIRAKDAAWPPADLVCDFVPTPPKPPPRLV